MKLINTIGNKLGRTGLKLGKASPTIMIVFGVGSVIGGTVLACRATLKAKDVMIDHKEIIDLNRDNLDDRNITQEDYKRHVTKQCLRTAGELVKLYALPVALEGLGIACIFGSHGIMTKRNASLTAAYAASTEALKAYREKVADRIGEGEEKNLYFGIEKDEETNDLVVKDETVTERDPYFRWFGPNCAPHWSGNVPYDLFFLQRQERYWNDVLRSRRNHAVFLNEVFESLGIPHSSVGAIDGWILNEDQIHDGDHISFGLKGEDGWILGAGAHSGEFPLEFNCDGTIYNLI